jgi:hypothetical protein
MRLWIGGGRRDSGAEALESESIEGSMNYDGAQTGGDNPTLTDVALLTISSTGEKIMARKKRESGKKKGRKHFLGALRTKGVR